MSLDITNSQTVNVRIVKLCAQTRSLFKVHRVTLRRTSNSVSADPAAYFIFKTTEFVYNMQLKFNLNIFKEHSAFIFRCEDGANVFLCNISIYL